MSADRLLVALALGLGMIAIAIGISRSHDARERALAGALPPLPASALALRDYARGKSWSDRTVLP